MLKVNSEFNKAFTGNMTKVAIMRRDQEGIHNAVGPHQEWLQLAGLSPDVAIQRALGWEKYIMQNPVQGSLEFLRARGVDLSQLQQAIQPEHDQYLTPEERQSREQMTQNSTALQQVTQRMDSFQQAQVDQQNSANYAYWQNELGTFIEAKDDSGNLKHPHIEHVANDMTEMVYASRQRGEQPNLENIYENAVWRNPETRKAQLSNWKADQVKENKERVKKVRKASSTIVTKSGGNSTPNAPRTSEQNVEAAWEQNARA